MPDRNMSFYCCGNFPTWALPQALPRPPSTDPLKARGKKLSYLQSLKWFYFFVS